MSIAEITTACRLELIDCPDFVITAELSRIARHICEETGIWRVNLPAVSLVDGTTLYDMTLPDGAEVVRMESLLDPENSETEILGLNWGLDEVSGQLFVSDVCRADIASVIPQAILAPTSEETIPECVHGECSDAMEYGVLAKLLMRPAKPWSSPDLGQYYAGLFRKEIGKKKIKLYTGSRCQSLRVRPVAFA